jgi:hypothetical protein
MGVVDLILFGSTAVVSALILATTVMMTLNPNYWQVGIPISVVSSCLTAFGFYSLVGSLGRGPAAEQVMWAVMILCTYAWLQISVLLVRAAGYRIVVQA